MQRFEYTMNIHTQKTFNCKWIETSNIKELFSLSSKPINESINERLVYPSIGKEGRNGNDDNEFIQIKKNKNFLSNYSKINEIGLPKTILTNEVIATWESLRKEKERKIEEEKNARKERFESLKNKAYELLNNFDFENASISYREAMNIFNDNSLNSFLEEIASKKLEKEELDTYNIAIQSDNTETLNNFIEKFPHSKYKEEITIKLRSKEAISGIPSIVKDKMNLKQFSNNTDNWVKKIGKESETIKTLGFEEEHTNQLYQIYEIEKTNTKLLKEWSKYKRNFINWYGEEKANEIIKKLGF
jgi:hypothetical protein